MKNHEKIKGKYLQNKLLLSHLLIALEYPT